MGNGYLLKFPNSYTVFACYSEVLKRNKVVGLIYYDRSIIL